MSYADKHSFIYGPSTANIVSGPNGNVENLVNDLPQHIEAFWSQWRCFMCDWWISLCKVNHEHSTSLDCVFLVYTVTCRGRCV